MAAAIGAPIERGEEVWPPVRRIEGAVVVKRLYALNPDGNLTEIGNIWADAFRGTLAGFDP